MYRLKTDDAYDIALEKHLYTSRDVKFMLGIKSDTTLIRLEREGKIKVLARIGNRKRYCPIHISKLFKGQVKLGM